MHTYGIIGGTLWGNRGAEAMVVTAVGRVRERDPQASFVVFSYYPDADRALLSDPAVRVADVRPKAVLVAWAVSLVTGFLALLRVRVPDAVLPATVRELRRCRVLMDVSGISFHDGRLAVVGYNLLCLWPAILLRVPVLRLSQAMGPFRHLLNRLPSRWVTRRSLFTFARGRLTAEHMAGLGVPADRWGVAPDVAFAYLPEFALTSENLDRVEAAASRLDDVVAAGGTVVALVPSSLVDQKTTAEGGDYVALLLDLVRSLQASGTHVLLMPNATRASSDLPRNNDLVVVRALVDRAAEAGVDLDAMTVVDHDLDTAAIRDLASRSAILVTSRFHAMVAALALGVPPVVMGWSHKYAEVLEMFGCEDHAVDFSEAAERVPGLVATLLADPEPARRRIQAALPDVTERSVAQFTALDALDR